MHTTDTKKNNYARSLIEANLSPVIIINTENKITDMNLVFANITGKSREELLGTNCYDYFSDPKKVKEACKRIFKKGFINNYELTITDHKEKDVLFNGFVYKDAADKVLGAMILGRDISKQKVIEDDLRDATKIAEEATEIAEKLTKIAEEAVKSKQQFLSNMSHEIRTPMNAIIGFTKVVLKTDLTAKQREYLTAIKMSGDALIVLINDILDLAKVDAGKMIFDKVPFKLSLSISAMLHLFETKIQEKNLTLITEYDESIPEVLLGDAARLHQIILNLVSNAVKFTHKGEITVSVRLLSEDDKNVTIQFAVNDTGIGIEENKLDKIFENFQQAYNLTSRLYGGTGLGLAIVKQLVEAQGGSIHVESKIDEGATFSFVLKFKKTKKEAVLDTEIMELDTEIKDISILVVEDMELNQLLMKTLLDDFGFECDITANGKLAIEKLETNTYDIILMDLQMPEMNGFE
ncbi:MAG: ATP-binding protein, partial [Flavobacterium sp.]